ncbi:hypothetical protein LX32DRAFT_163408 [Colletotrichum zoysiae]|uniref:Uncharacterized protein n=1 Tax=Colletotrichum zoysiae TaxID=1216348 RepID=A0AAD9H603_9PEZI|nr:hypothetical protein LX32DRAFT_163408 [Colletotrichum zoysiae]
MLPALALRNSYIAITADLNPMATTASSAMALTLFRPTLGQSCVGRQACNPISIETQDCQDPKQHKSPGSFSSIHTLQFIPGGPVPCLRSIEYMETRSAISSWGRGQHAAPSQAYDTHVAHKYSTAARRQLSDPHVCLSVGMRGEGHPEPSGCKACSQESGRTASCSQLTCAAWGRGGGVSRLRRHLNLDPSPAHVCPLEHRSQCLYRQGIGMSLGHDYHRVQCHGL